MHLLLKKLEWQVCLKLRDFEKAGNTLESQIREMYDQISAQEIKLHAFRKLREYELMAIPQRTEELTTQLAYLHERSAKLQKRFSNLLREREKTNKSQKEGNVINAARQIEFELE